MSAGYMPRLKWSCVWMMEEDVVEVEEVGLGTGVRGTGTGTGTGADEWIPSIVGTQRNFPSNTSNRGREA